MFKINEQLAIRIVDKFLCAVEKNRELAIKIPTRTTDELKKSADMIGTNCRVLLESIMG